MDLTDSQIERYSRQILLQELGGEGQERILAARVLVAGEGLALPIAARYLAAAGAGEIGLASGAGGDVLAADIHALNPEIRVTLHSAESPSQELVSGYDLLVAVSLGSSLRDHLNRGAVATGCPVITGACDGDHGFVAVLDPARGGGCLACVEWPSLGTAVKPLTPALAGAVGTLLATEALKAITGIGDPLTRRMLRIDARSSAYTTAVVQHRPSCLICRVT